MGNYLSTWYHNARFTSILHVAFESMRNGYYINALNDLKDALRHLYKAGYTKTKTQNKEHIINTNIAACYTVCAHQLIDQEDYDDSLIMYRAALNIEARIVRSLQIHIANNLERVGEVSVRDFNTDKALAEFNEALQIYTLMHGDVNADAARVLRSIAMCYSAQANYEDAIRTHRASINMLREIYGDDPHIKLEMKNLESYDVELAKIVE